MGAVALPSLLQFAVPTLLNVGRRDVSAVAAGQWWRLLTANFLQDGGWPDLRQRTSLLRADRIGPGVLLPEVTARALLYIIAGHHIHHDSVLRDRYLKEVL